MSGKTASIRGLRCEDMQKPSFGEGRVSAGRPACSSVRHADGACTIVDAHFPSHPYAGSGQDSGSWRSIQTRRTAATEWACGQPPSRVAKLEVRMPADVWVHTLSQP